jgi:hypothetical protein
LRRGADGSFCVMLTNACLDPSGSFTLRVNGTASSAEIYDSKTNTVCECVLVKDGDGCIIDLPSIDAWDYVVLMTK